MGRRRRLTGTGWYAYAPPPRLPPHRRPRSEPRRAVIERPPYLHHLRALPDGRLLVDQRPLAELVTAAEDEHGETGGGDDLGIGPFTFDERQYRGALGFDR
jgi:hypothetical protein